MSLYLLETKFKKFSIKEHVEAQDSLATLALSRLALQPFEDSIGDSVNAELVITNTQNTKETLTLTFNNGR